MSLEAEINIYKTRVILKVTNSGQTLRYILPVPTSVQYDPDWAVVTFSYNLNWRFRKRRTEKKIKDLSEKIGANITSEPPNRCGILEINMNLPQCYRVSIQDKGRVKEVQKNLLERAE